MRILFTIAALAMLSSTAHAECVGTVTSTTTNTVTIRLPKTCKPRKSETVGVSPVVVVPPGVGTLAAALTQAIAAQVGPVTLVLSAGVYSGNVVLPRTGSPYGITITGPLLPPGRVTPSVEGMLPRIVPTDLTSPTVTVQGDNYTLRGFQGETPGVGVTTIDVDVESHPRNLIFDQLLVRGNVTTGGHRGIGMNGVNVTVTNSWIDRMWEVGRDAQAVAAWDTPGPLRVENNYLEASGENLLLGGSVPTCGCVPSDVMITRNTFHKDPAWRLMAEQPTVKNLLEVKFGRRVTITGNSFQYHWQQAQSGWSILFTAMGVEGTPWTVVEDIIFTGNRIRDVSSGVNIAAVTGPVRRVRLDNNTWQQIDAAAYGGDGRFAIVQTGDFGVEDLTITHQTVIGATGNMFLGLYGNLPLMRFAVTHNIVEHSDYGIHATTGLARDALAVMAPGSVFLDNAILGPEASWLVWPQGNFPSDLRLADQVDADGRLLASSPLLLLPTSDGVPVGSVVP